MNSKIIKVLYGIFFPMIVITLLLGIASFNARPRLLGSFASDLTIRLLLCAWFCGLYIRLSRFSSYSIYPNKKWTKEDVGPVEKYFYIGLCFLFSAGCGLITWWVIQQFLPGLSYLTLITVVFNFLIVLLPMVKQYWVLKL